MCYKITHVWSATLFFLVLKLQTAKTNATPDDTFDLAISKVESRLNIAAKIVETARRELRSDLKQMCRNNSCSGKSIDCSNWRRSHDGKPMDCGDIYNDGYTTSGIYQIWPQSKISNGHLLVYCDMEDGGGWTVIQRRGDFGNSADYFLQDWNAYKTGFGHLLREFWIGNDNLYSLTSQRSYQLKINMKDLEESTITYATYNEFWVDDEVHDYQLHIGTYEGTAGDSLGRQNGSKFSTKDRDNDSNDSANCAATFQGAWWYSRCMDSNLNGMNLRGNSTKYGEGIIWKSFRGFFFSLKDIVMKIRSVDFEGRVNKIVN